MKKKVIGLSILLLVLLLGLFSVSYASSYTLTEQNIYDIWEANKFGGNNNDVNNGYGRAKRMIGEAYAQFDSVAISIYGRSVPYSCVIYGWNKSDVTSVSNYHDLNYMQIGLNGNLGKLWNVYSNQTQTVNTIALGTGSQLSTKYYFYSNDLILPNYTGPYETSEIVFPSEIFVFTRNSNLQYVNNGNIAIVDTSDRLGDVQQGHNYGAVEVSCNYWDKVRNSWVEFYWFANANNDNSDIVDIYISDFVNSSNNNIFPNVLVQTTYHSNNPDEFETDYFQPFIISDSHTVITNDEFDPDNTFDDDSYYNDYMNTINSIKDNDNTDKITDTLTDDSQVDSMLSEFTSGDANDLANRFGYSGIENPFVATIKNVVESTADVLLGSGNVTLDISFYGHQIILHSEDFVLPSNPVVNLIYLICNGFFIWGLYKYGFKLYQYINTGRIKKVIDETDSDKYYFF